MSMPPLPPGVSAPSREEERRSRDRLPRPALSYSTLHRAKEALCIAAGDAEWLKPSALALEACGESRLHLVSLLCSACSTCSRLRGRGVALCLPRRTGSARLLLAYVC